MRHAGKTALGRTRQDNENRRVRSARWWHGATVIAALTLLAAPGAAPGHDDPTEHEDPAVSPPPALSDAQRYAPSLNPDRIVLTFSGDPATTQAVTWRTSTEVTQAVAEIAEAEPGPGFTERAQRVEAITRPFTSDLSSCHVHAVVFRGLQADTLYAYRVGDGVNFSPWHQFQTAGPANKPFSFIYFGDAQNDVRSLWTRVVRRAFADAPRAAFTLHAGDLINHANRDGEWGEWFEAAGWINTMIPVVATPGNHEYYTVKDASGARRRLLSDHWGMQFAFPANGPEALRGTVYFVDYGETRIVSLNSNERTEEQAAWLDRILADNPRTWTIITFHHPIYSTAPKRDNPELRALWKPVFDRHHVDLVLNGHDHAYGRSGAVGVGGAEDADAIPPDAPQAELNVADGTRWRSDRGTVHVVSVSGPKMYAVTDEPRTAFRRTVSHMQLYQVISVAGPMLRYQARDATGVLRDAFTLRKRADGRCELIEDAAAPRAADR